MWLNREGSIPMHKPRICVIIPTYNSARFLPEAVESALYQTFSPEEVIVVDDGSTDNTEDVLEPFRGRIHYIRQENQGPAVARNRGISEAKGDLIAFLDADDVWVPDKSEKQVDLLMENPRIGLVHSLYDYLDMAREQRLVPRHGHGWFLRRLLSEVFQEVRGPNIDGSRAQEMCHGCGRIRRDHKVGFLRGLRSLASDRATF